MLPVSPEVQATLERLAQRLGVRRAVRVLHSTIAQVPVVVGYLRPVILLPLSLMTNMPASQLEAILAHELAHIRRHDYVVNLLQTLIETLFFYHPAVWWLSHRIRVEREHCCDDLVVGLLDNRVEYGRALVAVAALRGHGTLLAPGATDGSLLSRIRRIVGLQTAGAADSPWTVAALLSCCVGALLATGLLSFQLLAAMETKYPFRVTLPDGATVELLGISADGTDPSHWWAPDGMALESQPLKNNRITSNPDWKKDQRRFEVRYTGAEQVNWFFPGDGQFQASGTESQPPERLREHDIRPSPLPSLEPATVICAVGEDKFGPWATIDLAGRLRDISAVPPAPERFYSLFVPAGIETTNDKIQLKLQGLRINDARRFAGIEWVAVLKDGARKAAVHANYSLGPARVDFDVPIADVDHFEFRARTYRYWVTYENVAVQPGQKTDVKISISAPPPPAPDRYVAALPEGVKVEFAGMTKNAAPAKNGWRPDGSPIRAASEWPIHSYVLEGNVHSSGNPDNRPLDANAYDFLFTFEGLRRPPSLNIELPSQSRSFPHLPIQDPYRMRVSAQMYENAESLVLGRGLRPPYQAVVSLTDEPWGKWQQLSATGEFLNSQEEQDLYRASYSLFNFVRVAPDRNSPRQTALVMRCPVNYRREYALGLRAFDTTGKEVWVTDRHHTAVFPPAEYWECEWGTMTPLPPGTQLARYEFRLRPYRHRVTFNNISLTPNKTTDVSIQVEPLTPKNEVALSPRLSRLDEAAILHEKLKKVLPQSWTMQRQGLAFEFRGPRGTTHNEEAKITLWFSDHFADSPTLDKRDPKLPRIGSWGLTRIGQTLFVRNRAAEERWPLFLDDLYWSLPVEHVVLAGIINVDEKIDDPHSMMEVMWNAGTRIDVKFNEQGQRVCHMEYEPFYEKVGEYGVAKETGLVVIGNVPDPAMAKTEQEKAIALRFQQQLDLIKQGARKYGIRTISLQDYVKHLLQLKKEGRANAFPPVKDGNRIQVPQFEEAIEKLSITPAKSGVLMNVKGTAVDSAETSIMGAPELLVSMISNPELETLKKLLPPVNTLHLEPIELLDEGRFSQEKQGIKVRLVGTGSEQFAIVLARVRRIEELVPIEEDPQRMSDCAFVFDLKGQLIATIGGRGGRSASRDVVDILSLGPKEDWFVRATGFERKGAFRHRSEFYRIASPVVKSLRHLHYANSNSWSQGPEKIVRWGRLSFDFPRVADKLSFESTGLTSTGVPMLPQITWDGDRNRFFGAVTQSVKGQPLFEVDTAWSGDFEPLNPQANQLVIIGGIYDYDHWHAWETVVPDQVEATAILTIPQTTGAPQVIKKKLPTGRSLLQLQVKPAADAESIDLVLQVGKDKQALKAPHQLGAPFANEPPIVQVVNPGQSARLCSRLLKSSNELLTFDVELVTGGAQSKP